MNKNSEVLKVYKELKAMGFGNDEATLLTIAQSHNCNCAKGFYKVCPHINNLKVNI